MARICTGALVMCSDDRLLAGLAAVNGDYDEVDRLFADVGDDWLEEVGEVGGCWRCRVAWR